MSKKLYIIIVSVLTALIIQACSEEKNIAGPVKVDQIAIASFDQIRFNFKEDWIFFSGRIYAEPIPDVDNFSINGEIFIGEDNSASVLGYVSLNPDLGDYFQITYATELEINTGLGSLNGTVNEPDELVNVKVNDTASDYYYQTDLNNSVDLTWESSYPEKSDFILIVGWYEDINGQMIDEKIILLPNTSTSIRLFEEDETVHEGEIWINISSVNGPFPEAGSAGNMTGDGSGYLYRRLLTESGIIGIEVGQTSKVKSLTDEEIIEKSRNMFMDYLAGKR